MQNLKGKRIYSIEGNIGAGKTTILKIIEKSFKDIAFVEEPISKWQNIGNEEYKNLSYAFEKGHGQKMGEILQF